MRIDREPGQKHCLILARRPIRISDLCYGNETVWRETLVFLVELVAASDQPMWLEPILETLFGKNFGGIPRRWVAAAMAEGGAGGTESDAAEFVDYLARRSGLLLPRGQDQFAFLHLSFQEYFAAVFLQNQIASPAWLMGGDRVAAGTAKEDLRSYPGQPPPPLGQRFGLRPLLNPPPAVDRFQIRLSDLGVEQRPSVRQPRPYPIDQSHHRQQIRNPPEFFCRLIRPDGLQQFLSLRASLVVRRLTEDEPVFREAIDARVVEGRDVAELGKFFVAKLGMPCEVFSSASHGQWSMIETNIAVSHDPRRQ